ncbi:hypothetical protein D3C83_80120 [compost metagenome]
MVDAHAPFDALFDFVGQAFIGAMHVGEFGIAAVLGQLMGVKHGRERRLFSIGQVRMPEVTGRDDADEFTVDLLIGEDGNFRKARHPLILVI